jgi:NADPH:quinone reductase-like Zn-dependent oxidoreductase/acyl carrier protein
MGVVELGMADVEPLLTRYGGRITVGGSNDPRTTLLSGETEALEALLSELQGRGVFGRLVRGTVPSHGPRVDFLLADVRELLSGIEARPGTVPIYSTVTGRVSDGSEYGAGYWADNLRQPVRFAEAVQALLDSGHGLFVEMSPNPVLVASLEEARRGAERKGLGAEGALVKGAAVGSLRRGQDERTTLLEALGALWVHGYPMAWERLFPTGGRRVALPTYAWQRERYWIEAKAHRSASQRRIHGGGHPLLGEAQLVSTQAGMRLWETMLELGRLPWLRDHQVQGAVVLPGAAFLEMALSSGAQVFDGSPPLVTDVVLAEALAFAGDSAVQVQMVTTEEQPGRVRFQIASQVPGAGRASFRVHVRGVLRRAERAEAPVDIGAKGRDERALHPVPPMPLDLAALRARLGESVPLASIYAALGEMGQSYGPAFQGIAELWRGEGEALGRVRLPEAAGAAGAYLLHPALLDACFQIMGGAFAGRGETTPWVPVEVGSLRLFQRPGGELWCHARAVTSRPKVPDRQSADLWVVDGKGALVAEVSGMVVQRLSSSASRREEDDWFLQIDWERAAVPAPNVTAGRWLLLGAGAGLGAALGAALAALGHAVIQAAGEDTSAAGMRALLAEAFGGQAPTGVVHLGSLDGGAWRGPAFGAQGALVATRSPDLDHNALEAALRGGCDSVLGVVQALTGMGFRDAPRLWLVTRGAQAVGAGDVSVGQAPLLGLGRVIALEHAELRCALVDLDPVHPAREVDALLAELLADDAEEEVALRGGGRYVSRLVHQEPQAERREKVEAAGNRSFRLSIDAPGVLDRLVLRAMERRVPDPGEVQIAVEAAGLNFLDVLLALGLMPNDLPGEPGAPLLLGGECVGRVVAVGEGVCGLVVGQPVIALARGALASHVTTKASLVLPRPAGLSATEAAAMPIAYLTAWFALDRVARLKPGERVLIHAATGGVGLAAVQWAQRVGAEVYATAGTPEKRAYLESLGVRYVSDSRSDQFVADVLAWTCGEGVDVVLNSLSGELISKSFALLRSYGRFVELGKRDYYANNQLGMRPFLRNLSFSLVDLRGMIIERPACVRALFEEMLDLVAAGAFTPPPIATLPISQAADAFRTMAQAQHLGKLVFTLGEPEAVDIGAPGRDKRAPGPQIRVAAESNVAIRRDGSYLVTGGLGGLGLCVASWLAEQGAGHLVLVGRSGAASPAQQAAVAALEARGARVTVAKADVAARAQVERVLREVAASGKPLRGVVHAAVLLDDSMLIQQTPARFRTVMAPKVQGALHLHALTRDAPLDFFVLYASAAGLLGSPGQGNYAAANTFLDALAHHRRAQGLPALSIDWGLFGEVGLSAAQENRGKRLVSRGMRSLTPAEGLSALQRLLDGDCVQAGVVPLNLRQWVGFNQAAASSRRLSRLMAAQRAGAGRPDGNRALLDRLAAAEPAARAALFEEVVRAQVSQVLRIPEGKVDVDAPLTSLGMDSLMGLELRNRIEAALGVTAPATLLWTYPTVAALSAHLAFQVVHMQDGERGPPPDAPSVAPHDHELADLDEDGLFALLDEALAQEKKRPVTA